MQHVQDSTNNLIRDRRWRLHKYKACLEAKETLTSIVQAELVKDRAEGVLVLRRCVEAGYLAHVTNQNHFTDTYLFFRVVTNTKGDGGQQLPSLAEAKETEGSKHGPASVRCRGFTAKNRYLVLSNGVVYEYPNAHAPFPVLSLPITNCTAGTITYCGKIKTGQYGLGITPPLCESSSSSSSSSSSVEESAALDAQDQSGESKTPPQVIQNSETSMALRPDDNITFLFNTIQEQESWLGALVKAGLNFEESSPSAAESKLASSILEFKVEEPEPSNVLVDLKQLCHGKVTVLVNVASF